jgi:hypothetical protein
LGSAEITHPFHPLRGRRFVVLKIRKVSGVELLSLRDADLGSFAIAREWTDWAVPERAADFQPPLILTAEGLVALAEQLAVLQLSTRTYLRLTHDSAFARILADSFMGATS